MVRQETEEPLEEREREERERADLGCALRARARLCCCCSCPPPPCTASTLFPAAPAFCLPALHSWQHASYLSICICSIANTKHCCLHPYYLLATPPSFYLLLFPNNALLPAYALSCCCALPATPAAAACLHTSMPACHYLLLRTARTQPATLAHPIYFFCSAPYHTHLLTLNAGRRVYWRRAVILPSMSFNQCHLWRINERNMTSYAAYLNHPSRAAR